jgi:putative addiction module component (TIGR02574 family)
MSTEVETLEQEVLKLNNTDRTRILETLISSLDEDDEIELAWAAEITQRVTEIESGVVIGIPLDEAIARARIATSARHTNWINEALRREAAIQSGEDVMLSSDEVLRELRAARRS